MPPDVRLLDAPLDPASELARFVAAHPQSGGIASFIGQVRAEAGEAAVLELELSHYPPLTLPGLVALADEAATRTFGERSAPANSASNESISAATSAR